MTREETKARFKSWCQREIGNHCSDEDYAMFNNIMALLEQESVIDKIRAEIEDLDRYFDNDYFSGNNDPMYKCNEVLQIIDKYKAESEDKE